MSTDAGGELSTIREGHDTTTNWRAFSSAKRGFSRTVRSPSRPRHHLDPETEDPEKGANRRGSVVAIARRHAHFNPIRRQRQRARLPAVANSNTEIARAAKSRTLEFSSPK